MQEEIHAGGAVPTLKEAVLLKLAERGTNGDWVAEMLDKQTEAELTEMLKRFSKKEPQDLPTTIPDKITLEFHAAEDLLLVLQYFYMRFGHLLQDAKWEAQFGQPEQPEDDLMALLVKHQVDWKLIERNGSSATVNFMRLDQPIPDAYLQVMANLSQSGIMDINYTYTAPHPNSKRIKQQTKKFEADYVDEE
ncbi:hypothetical protein ACFST9_14760 [Hymenobacter monticola]|uniref:Uncharacterized protein n=1 Tax=Hymenobacter monticola TaxID=1705399 RepID=A0ABY4B0Y5_9BACT|nr:hypothetical protein [Hymenobacter monticola]UOE32826.1 hypothetical protein MTP16_17025 [Hymenobacter monticola]